MQNNIQSTLTTKATASLEEEVKKDLEQEDPTPDKAKAILNNEAPTGNDGKSSN